VAGFGRSYVDSLVKQTGISLPTLEKMEYKDFVSVFSPKECGDICSIGQLVVMPNDKLQSIASFLLEAVPAGHFAQPGLASCLGSILRIVSSWGTICRGTLCIGCVASYVQLTGILSRLCLVVGEGGPDVVSGVAPLVEQVRKGLDPFFATRKVTLMHTLRINGVLPKIGVVVTHVVAATNPGSAAAVPCMVVATPESVAVEPPQSGEDGWDSILTSTMTRFGGGGFSFTGEVAPDTPPPAPPVAISGSLTGFVFSDPSGFSDMAVTGRNFAALWNGLERLRTRGVSVDKVANEIRSFEDEVKRNPTLTWGALEGRILPVCENKTIRGEMKTLIAEVARS
jgi:hypothetical protein